MKLNKFLFVLAAFLGLFSFSCSKEPASVTNNNEILPVENFIDGKILSKKAELCLFGRDSEMHGVIKLSCGDDISVLEIDGVIDTKFVPDEIVADSVEKKLISIERPGAMTEKTEKKGSETSETLPKGKEYVHVVHENMDFWLEKTVFALNCENAVAIEKTFLYSDSALTKKIDSPQNPLKFATIITKSNGVEPEENSNSSATKVFYYDTKEKSVRQAFVSSASISSKKDDIVVSQIAEELKVTKRAVPRNELFARAAKYKPCPKVLAVLKAQSVETKTYSYQEVLKSMQKMSFGVNVDELLTVDQSKDPFK